MMVLSECDDHLYSRSSETFNFLKATRKQSSTTPRRSAKRHFRSERRALPTESDVIESRDDALLLSTSQRLNVNLTRSIVPLTTLCQHYCTLALRTICSLTDNSLTFSVASNKLVKLKALKSLNFHAKLIRPLL